MTADETGRGEFSGGAKEEMIFLSMSFRRTRRSNDGLGWVALILSLFGTAFTSAMCFATLFFGSSGPNSESLIPKVFLTLLFLLFLIAFIYCAQGILFPYEFEVVIEQDCIRWGKASRPSKQERLLISKVVRIVHDKSEGKILADTGIWRYTPIAEIVLTKSKESEEFLLELRKMFPALPIEIRG